MYHLAFPQEFRNLENASDCKKDRIATSKTIAMPDPPLENTTTLHVTEKECKLYCASAKSCWGCSKVCNETCKWNAVTSCEQVENIFSPAKKSSSKKLGIYLWFLQRIHLTRKFIYKYVQFNVIWVVCFDIKLNIAGESQNENDTILNRNSTVRWKLGTCSSLNSIEAGTTYQYPGLYTERCCLESGRHTLLCHNIPPARGWKDAYVLIDGHRLCDDFVNYRSFQKILITGASFNILFVLTFLYNSINNGNVNIYLIVGFSPRICKGRDYNDEAGHSGAKSTLKPCATIYN